MQVLTALFVFNTKLSVDEHLFCTAQTMAQTTNSILCFKSNNQVMIISILMDTYHGYLKGGK